MEGPNVDSVCKEENPQAILKEKKNERESKSLSHLLILGDEGGFGGSFSRRGFCHFSKSFNKRIRFV